MCKTNRGGLVGGFYLMEEVTKMSVLPFVMYFIWESPFLNILH